ncbi:hypothetical protein SDC9_124034 [bioreactor metagenome]|uniref:Uncharacterized protein n=1 Tax=bioreactor metagenome TaxID=1076179 RepID=A0A645CJB2_9ZZZZ
MLHALGIEFVQNRYDDSSISESRQKDNRPAGVVLPDQRNLISFFYSKLFKQDMNPCNFFSQLAVG